MIADLTNAIESPLDHGLSADEDAIAEFHRLRVFQNHVRPYLQVVANAFTHRAHDHPAHHGIEGTLSGAKPREKIVQLLFCFRCPQGRGKVALPRRIVTKFPAAEGGRDLPDT